MIRFSFSTLVRKSENAGGGKKKGDEAVNRSAEMKDEQLCSSGFSIIRSFDHICLGKCVSPKTLSSVLPHTQGTV